MTQAGDEDSAGLRSPWRPTVWGRGKKVDGLGYVQKTICFALIVIFSGRKGAGLRVSLTRWLSWAGWALAF
jgi:hypothetical protein